MSSKQAILIRMPEDLHERLREQAHLERRSMNYLVQRAVESYLAEHDTRPEELVAGSPLPPEVEHPPNPCKCDHDISRHHRIGGVPQQCKDCGCISFRAVGE